MDLIFHAFPGGVDAVGLRIAWIALRRKNSSSLSLISKATR
jgi:hypothetical protein